MAGIDVNDVMVDPEFATVFDVKRRTEVVNNQGRTELTETMFPAIVGIITWTEAGISRGEDGTIVPQSLNVVTPFSLRDNSQGFAADVIVWQGEEYLVKSIKANRHLGRGFTRASAETTRTPDLPPPTGSVL